MKYLFDYLSVSTIEPKATLTNVNTSLQFELVVTKLTKENMTSDKLTLTPQ